MMTSEGSGSAGFLRPVARERSKFQLRITGNRFSSCVSPQPGAGRRPTFTRLNLENGEGGSTNNESTRTRWLDQARGRASLFSFVS